jgi:hypothetical protein
MVAMVAAAIKSYRYFSPLPDQLKIIDGISFFEIRTKNNHGKLLSLTYGVDFPKDIVVTLTRENYLDRFFKTIGLSKEFQTGDVTFDSKVYIASDHYLFHQALHERSQARELLVKIFNNNYDRIWSDGKYLLMQTLLDRDARQDVPLLDQLAREFSIVLDKAPNRFFDSFTKRAFTVECIIASIFGYAMVSVAELMIRQVDIHFNAAPLIYWGALLCAAAFVLLPVGIVLFLQRSSLSHRILTESGIFLILSLPIACFQLTSDLNRMISNSPQQVIQALVMRKWEQKHPGRRGGTRYSYHIQIYPFTNKQLLQEKKFDISISSEIYSRVQENENIKLVIETGLFGVPWIKSINGNETINPF